MTKEIIISWMCILILTSLISVCSGSTGDWVISGNSVYIDNTDAHISVTPHTLPHSGYITLNITAKSYTGDIDLAFLFDEADGVKPISCELLLPGGSYTSVVSQFEKQDFNHDGFDTIYLGRNLPVISGHEYSLRVWVDKPNMAKGKYGVALKPSGQSLYQAISTGHFYYLDPWFSSGTNHYGADWTPDNTTSISGRHFNVGTFTIASGYTVTVDAGVELEVYADTIDIDGTLSADGNGTASGTGNGGDGGDNSAGAGGGGGAGYGGAGSAGKAGDFGAAGTAGATYGDNSTKNVSLGSKGGNGGVNSGDHGAGGSGGGSILLCGATVEISGTITSDGNTGGVPGQGGGGGGGSGGGILVVGQDVTVSGTLTATGGNGGNSGSDGDGAGGGGGGGRIKIVYSSSLDTAGITTSVTGGTGGTGITGVAGNGAAGTYTTFTNTPPTTPSLILPTNLSVEDSSPITLDVVSSDTDGDILTYEFFGGFSSDELVFLGVNETGEHNIDWYVYTYDTYYWTARASDGYEYSSNMTTVQFNAIIPPNATTNLLLNPDFENWTGANPDNWSFWTSGTGTLSQESSIVYNGSYSSHVKTTAADQAVLYQAFADYADYKSRVLSFSLYAYGTNYGTNQVFARFINNIDASTPAFLSETNGWQYLNTSHFISQDATYENIDLYAYNLITDVYFDNITLTEGYDPSIVPYPGNGTTINATYPPMEYEITFDWQDVGAPNYRLVVSDDQFLAHVVVDTVTTEDEYSVSLVVGETYYWRVYAYDGSHYSVSSPIWHFTIDAVSSISGSAIEGVVYSDTDGTYTPLSNAEVSIWNDTWTDTMITGSNGYYAFVGLANGSLYSLQVRRDLYLTSTIATVNTTGEPVTQNFYLLPDRTSEEWRHYVKFIVTTIWGTRYPGVTVTVYENGDVDYLYTGETGADGSITFVMNRQTQYRTTFVNATLNINEERYLYPKDDLYYIIVSSSLGSWDTYDTPIADAIDFDISTNEKNSTHAYINVSYLDTENGTSSLTVYLNTTNSTDYINQTNLDTWSAGATNNSSHSFIVSGYAGQGYFIHLLVIHDDYGTIDSVYATSFDNDISLQFPGIPQSVWLYGAIFMMIFSAGIFTVTTREAGMFIISVENFVYIGLGCYSSLPGGVQDAVLGGTILSFIISLIALLNDASKKEGYK